jgi:hypothetical protein
MRCRRADTHNTSGCQPARRISSVGVTQEEASQLIRTIADSLEQNQNQFTLNVNVTGTNVGGGSSLTFNTQGGAEGSATTGLHSEASAGDARIVIERSTEAPTDEFRQQLQDGVDLLRQLADATEPEERVSLLARLRDIAVIPQLAVEVSQFVLMASHLVH